MYTHRMDNNDLTKSRAERLRQARKRVFNTATEAATRLGVGYSTYSAWENGRRGITADAAKRIAPVLKTTPEWILFGSGKQPGAGTTGKNIRNLSLFLTFESDYFQQILKGLYPEPTAMISVDASEELPKRLFCVGPITDRGMERKEWPAYPRGCKVFVDPDAAYEPGDVVHVWIEELKDSIIREYRERRETDGKITKILTPYNTAASERIFHPESGDFIIGLVDGILSLPRRR